MPGFAKLGGITGAAVPTTHRGEIEFDSFRFGVTAEPPPAAGPATFDRIELTRNSDVATAGLLDAATRGTVFDTGRLSIATAWGDQIVVHLVIDLEQVTIGRVATFWDGAGLPREHVALGYSRVRWTATPATPAGGEASIFDSPASRLRGLTPPT